MMKKHYSVPAKEPEDHETMRVVLEDRLFATLRFTAQTLSINLRALLKKLNEKLSYKVPALCASEK